MAKQVYNNFNTTEKYELFNSFNKSLLKDWMLELKSQGKSKKTINVYYNNILILYTYILEELDNVPIYKLKKKDYRNYILWLREKELGSERIKNLKSACSSMLNYACDEEDYEELIPVNLIARLKPIPKEERREIIFLTNKQIEYIYNRLMELERYRDALLIAFAYESASRRNELYQVKRNDISLDSNMTKSKVVGKRGKKFYLFYFDKTKEAYTKYMEQRTDDNNDLWVDKNGQTIAYATLYDIIISCRKILEELEGEYIKFNPHSFRHSAAYNLKTGEHWALKGMNKKMSLEELQSLLNHSDVSTTQGYLPNEDVDIVLQAFGLNQDE